MPQPSPPRAEAAPAEAIEERTTIAGTCVALDGQGVLLRGPSGAGKSDLALRLLMEGARLVADDQTTLVHRGAGLIASAPVAILGLLEVRGLGILRFPTLSSAPLACVVDLVPAREVVRLPELERATLLGVALPHFHLDAFAASATAKVRLAVRIATGGIIRLP